MPRFVVAFLFACAFAPAAFGQIIYENVRYQYRPYGETFYYGGSEPRAFAWAERQAEIEARGFGRRRTIGFSGGVGTGDGLINDYSPVYSDLFPYRDARRFGFTADDARNEAVRSAPVYFRKIDLLRAAEVQPDGSVLVPLDPRMVVIIDRKRETDDADAKGTTRPGSTTRPATTGKITIIPKPKPAKSDKPVVASR